MTDDNLPAPDADAETLSGALYEGDAETAGKLMMMRTTLSREEIELIADLLLGNKAAKKYCSHRLVFERWGRGRPTDHLEQRARSQTLADRVGACAVALDPIVQALRQHVLEAERIHADDTTVPVLAKLKTVTGRLWTYVRDDRPFGGTAPPAAIFHYSRSRHGDYPREHLAGYGGIMQADAFAGYNELFTPGWKPRPIVEAACWAHGRRKFFDLAKLSKAPIAIEAVRRIDEIFAIERAILGKTPAKRVVVRQAVSKPLVIALEAFLREKRAILSARSETAKAINYGLNHWPAFTRFLDDGRICLSNNAAERPSACNSTRLCRAEPLAGSALRGIAIGRRNWTFCGSDAGGHRAATIYTLIETAKLNDVDPQASLAWVLAKLPDHPAKRIDEMLPWNWKAARTAEALAKAA